MTDLEKEIREASIDYQMENYPMAIGGATFEDAVRDLNVNPSFIAGAEWMKERIEKDVLSAEVLMSSSGTCRWLIDDESAELSSYLINNGFRTGDKVKLIILKEDEKAD